MKKRLEAELISIAHRVLKLKNKSEVDQLYLETQKLYETLSVLKFYGDHIEQVKATISEAELEEKLAISLEVEPVKTQPIEEPIAVVEATPEAEPVAVVEAIEEEQNQLVTAEEESDVTNTKVVAVEEDSEEKSEEAPIIVGEIAIDEDEEIEEEIASEDAGFDPIFEMASEKMEEEIIPKQDKTKQISFEHLLGEDYKEPDFVKHNDVTTPSTTKVEKEEEHIDVLIDKNEKKATPLNDKLATGINIGLNDRVGFVKYLFDNSTEDYNRVLSQLNTFDTFSEAKEFIEDMVKPDYSNWIGQEDFAERFMEIVEKKFG
jgi:hypothetical protein